LLLQNTLYGSLGLCAYPNTGVVNTKRKCRPSADGIESRAKPIASLPELIFTCSGDNSNRPMPNHRCATWNQLRLSS